MSAVLLLLALTYAAASGPRIPKLVTPSYLVTNAMPGQRYVAVGLASPLIGAATGSGHVTFSVTDSYDRVHIRHRGTWAGTAATVRKVVVLGEWTATGDLLSKGFMPLTEPQPR